MLIISGVNINRGRVYAPLEYAIRQACHNRSSDNLIKVGVFLRYGASLKSRPRHSAAKDLIEFAKLNINGNQIPYLNPYLLYYLGSARCTLELQLDD